MRLIKNLNLLWAFGYIGLFYLFLVYLGDDISTQGYIVLGLLVVAFFWQIILWIAKMIGFKVELEEEKLLQLIDDEIVEIGKTSKIDVSILKQELVNRVKSKQIKCARPITGNDLPWT